MQYSAAGERRADRVQPRKLSGMKEMRKPTSDPIGEIADEKPSFGDPRRERTRSRSRAPFRSRLFAMLLLFAVVPTIAVTALWTGTASRALSMMSSGSAWERVARSGEGAIAAARSLPLTAEQRQLLDRHERELRESVELGTRFDFVAARTMRVVLVGALVVVVLVAVGASRVAGHLSRQLSRPLDELVGWTGLIRTGRAVPEQTERPGAPEFEVLRTGMRTMVRELEIGRRRALEAERADAFRESARRFAHELKNPLTPIRFAVERLRRSVPDELRETVDVLAEESARLDVMARSFAQFGRLPDGPAAEIDIAELVTRTVRNTIPEGLTVSLDVEPGLPLVMGFHEPLVRAVANVLLNAVDACMTCGERAEIAVRVQRDQLDDRDALRIAVRDSGCGISEDALAHIFEPYMTTKPGGTGLGLAIAQQTVVAHHGVIEATSTPGAGTELRLRLPITGVQGA